MAFPVCKPNSPQPRRRETKQTRQVAGLALEDPVNVRFGMLLSRELPVGKANSRTVKSSCASVRPDTRVWYNYRGWDDVSRRKMSSNKDKSRQVALFKNTLCINKVQLASYRAHYNAGSQESPSHSRKEPSSIKPVSNEAPITNRLMNRSPNQSFRPATSTPSNYARSVTEGPSVALRRNYYKKAETISVKEAMRDKEWLNKAKAQVIRDLNKLLNKSNGIVVAPVNLPAPFRYYLGPGNNCSLVKQVLASRWWWVRVNEEEKATANLVWTQLRDRTCLSQLPSLKDAQTSWIPVLTQTSITAHTRYTAHLGDTILATTKVVDLAPLNYDLITRSRSFATLEQTRYVAPLQRVHNRLEGNSHLANKKALFHNLRSYYAALGRSVFEVMPETYHVVKVDHPSYQEFLKKHSDGYWIVKPGEDTNQGHGITVCSNLDQIKRELATGPHTHIVQRYIDKPFLIHKRKFDIRCYAMVTAFNGVLQGYFYQEGYIRTSSKGFTLANVENKFIHLTNDAVQQFSEDYGKYENGNKMSYTDFQRYLDNCTSLQCNFTRDVVSQIKAIVKDTIQAVFLKLDPNRRAHSFEIFGYDFILDADLKPWLLEVNTNPCLALSSPHLVRIIPALLENSFKIALDPLFPEPPTSRRSAVIDSFAENKYELIFHSQVDGQALVDTLTALGTLQNITQSSLDILSNAEVPEDTELLAA